MAGHGEDKSWKSCGPPQHPCLVPFDCQLIPVYKNYIKKKKFIVDIGLRNASVKKREEKSLRIK